MNRSAIRALQQVLLESGHYRGAIDGLRGKRTDSAIKDFLTDRSNDVSGDPTSWSRKRQAIAALQLICIDHNIDVGPVDGLWGPRTDAGVDELVESQATGQPPVMWRDVPASETNPHGWPQQTEKALRQFYGPPCEVPLVQVPCPWTLSLDWNRRQTRDAIRCHERVAQSLERVLTRVHGHYGDQKIRELELHLFGGSYNCRQIRGGTSWSTHAWGIAIDWIPSKNKLKWGRDRATLAAPDYDAWWSYWEEEGWLSLGRHRNFDWMHVQAARL